jgi:hypothetical protein
VSGVDELVAFLRRCLDEDERAIERMRSTPMHGVESGAEEDYLMFADRAPAEVKAKRAILDEIEGWCEVEDEYDPVETSFRAEAEPMLRLLAQPYAGHEGWRDEWRVAD